MLKNWVSQCISYKCIQYKTGPSHELTNIEIPLARRRKNREVARELHGIRWDFKQQGWYCILPPVSFTQLDCVEPGAQWELRNSESGYAGHGVFDICSGRAMWVWIFDLLRTHYPAAAMLFPFMQTSKVLPIGEVLNLTPGFVKGNGLSWCPMCIQTQKFFGAGLH